MSIANGLKHLGFDPIRDFSCQNDGNGVYLKEWLSDKPQPSEAEIAQAITDAETQYTATQYQRSRAAEYPSLAEQLDYIYHNGVEAWKTDIIDPIKARYPKP